MPTIDLQQQLFGYIKENLPPHLSLADELCDLLNLSPDSAYRRIRGEKPISLSELKKLCEHYFISLDQVLQLQNDSVVFNAPAINQASTNIKVYLQGLVEQIKYFNNFKERKLLYLCKDVPVFHFYMFPEIAAFKSFFWSKSILNDPEYNSRTFKFSDIESADCYQLGQKLLKGYNEFQSVELWNHESINSTINQIEYYRDAGLFHSGEDLLAVIESLQKMLDHLQLQAEKGVKFLPGATGLTYKAPFQFYINELILGNNSMLLQLDGLRLAFVTYNVLNFMTTRDARFTNKAFQNFETLVSRSTMISGTGERDRNRFFKKLREKIQQCRHGL